MSGNTDTQLSTLYSSLRITSSSPETTTSTTTTASVTAIPTSLISRHAFPAVDSLDSSGLSSRVQPISQESPFLIDPRTIAPPTYTSTSTSHSFSYPSPQIPVLGDPTYPPQNQGPCTSRTTQERDLHRGLGSVRWGSQSTCSPTLTSTVHYSFGVNEAELLVDEEMSVFRRLDRLVI